MTKLNNYNDVKAAADQLLSLPMVSWSNAVEEFADHDKHALCERLDGIIERAGRLRAYLDARGGLGDGDKGHAVAVKRQNSLAGKLRKVLGYTVVRQDFTF